MKDSALGVQIHSMPSSSQRKPLFIVGDVHGCADELEALINKAKTLLPPFQLMLVGDLFTKGPDPIGVYDLIKEHQGVSVQGNHDWSLRMVLDALLYRSRALGHLSPCMKQTLHAIRYHKQALWNFLNSLPHVYTSCIELAVKKPENWETTYPLVLLHAGYDAQGGLKQTSEHILLTARYVRWDYDCDGQARMVVTGPVSDSHGQGAVFRWHELHQGPELVVFGHDAKQGLFRKALPNSRPVCIGLDTGCTYGHSLTGYCPEFDMAVQVRSKRRYFDSQRNIILM